ncbi:MAG: sortase [Candidatus Levybacteria bacterium]|nr:sortase [Candidatus Levybacteria bacterium]
MQRSEKIKFLILRSIGNFLVLLSIYGVIATFGPALTFEIKYRLKQARGVEYTVANLVDDRDMSSSDIDKKPDNTMSFGQLLSGETKQSIVPIDTNFSIVIPKIGASSRVIPNVDPTNPDIFKPALLQGVAHAKGTVFPGLPGNTYIFAHSTDSWWNVGRYNAVFYLLKDLEPGDEIVVFFEGVRYNYVIDKKVITDPSEVSYLVNSHDGPEQLVLQTCWPPGTTWKRLFVIAKPKSST